MTAAAQGRRAHSLQLYLHHTILARTLHCHDQRNPAPLTADDHVREGENKKFLRGPLIGNPASLWYCSLTTGNLTSAACRPCRHPSRPCPGRPGCSGPAAAMTSSIRRIMIAPAAPRLPGFTRRLDDPGLEHVPGDSIVDVKTHVFSVAPPARGKHGERRAYRSNRDPHSRQGFSG